jgi:hypothetical protein
VTGAHARRPSGDTVGGPMRLIAHKVSTVTGGLRLRRAGIGGDLGRIDARLY